MRAWRDSDDDEGCCAVKITFVIPRPDMSGGLRVVAIYAQRLRARGHDVCVVAAGPRKPRRWDVLNRILAGGERKARRGRSHFDGTDIDLKMVDHDRPLADADLPDADVVIATWWRTAFEVSALSPSKGSKFYFVQHHEIHDFVPAHLSHGSYYLPLKKITISQWLVDVMRDTYGDDDVALVHNSVDREQFFAPPRTRNKTPTIGLLYATATFKGVAVSLRAIDLARQSLPDINVVAFGSTALTAKPGLPPGSSYHRDPAQERLRDIYAACDVWLCGSWAEGFHLPPLEAMACRCPVVSTRVGGPVDTVVDGVNGYLVDVGDSDALAARLLDVLRQPPEAWNAMSEAALSVAAAYSWDDVCMRFERALVT
jgi:glycosyltransferase involved in cell wall biosynthesis